MKTRLFSILIVFFLSFPYLAHGGSKGLILQIESKTLCCLNYYGIKRALKRTEGVKTVIVRANKRQITIYYDSDKIDKEGLIRKIKSVRGVGRFVDTIKVVRE